MRFTFGILVSQCSLCYSESLSDSSSTAKAAAVFVRSFWQTVSPRHAQKSVHDNLADVHRHSAVLHGLSEEHPHRIISRISGGARGTFGGSITGSNVLDCSSRVHPYCVGSNDGGCASSADFHITVWMWARRTFCSNDSVAGISNRGLLWASASTSF